MKKNLLILSILAVSIFITGCSNQKSNDEDTNITNDNGGVFTSDPSSINDTENNVENQRTILFFHADWCPICRKIEEDIIKSPERIPSNVKIVKIDFENSDDLRSKYGVNTQYTFVEIDENQNEIDQWSSISLNDLINKINQ